MALSSATLTSALIAAGPPEVNGLNLSYVASVIGQAVYSWIIVPSNVYLSGTTVGASGLGTVVGSLAVPPNQALVSAGLSAAGVAGQASPNLAKMLAVGLSVGLSSAQYTGPSVGVGSGVDTSTVAIANSLTLSTLLSAQFTGSSGSQVSAGIALGISNLLLASTGAGVVTGPSSGSPTTGVSPLSSVF